MAGTRKSLAQKPAMQFKATKTKPTQLAAIQVIHPSHTNIERVCPVGYMFLKTRAEAKEDSAESIKICITSCSSVAGYQDNISYPLEVALNMTRCYSNKRCPDSTGLYARMGSSGDDNEIHCQYDCTIEQGYKDLSESGNNKCYYDYKCSTDAPFAITTSDLTSGDFKCVKSCDKSKGVIDESKPNGTWCFSDAKCLNTGAYLRVRSDDLHTSTLCMSSCYMQDGYIDGQNCYYGTFHISISFTTNRSQMSIRQAIRRPGL